MCYHKGLKKTKHLLNISSVHHFNSKITLISDPELF